MAESGPLFHDGAFPGPLMLSLLLSCKQCGAPVDPGARGALAGPRVLVDAACGRCGKRALYEMPHGTVARG